MGLFFSSLVIIKSNSKSSLTKIIAKKHKTNHFLKWRKERKTRYLIFTNNCRWVIFSFIYYHWYNRSAKGERSATSGNLCDVQLLDLYLVACLGLEGVDALRLSQNLVPEAFCNLRSQYICRIVNHVVGSSVMNSSNYDQNSVFKIFSEECIE